MQLFRFGFFAMACENEVQLFAMSESDARVAADAAIAEVRRLEGKYSRYRDDSVVASINRSAGIAAVEVDAETTALLDYADACFAESGGLFDITSGVLRRAWDFKAQRPPARERIAPLLHLIGWRKVERNAKQVYLPQRGMELDFGGFGKEYAVDRAVQICLGCGITSGLINLGGDLCALAPRPDAIAWGVGIRHPRRDGEVAAVLPLHSGAIATSGDYERYIDFDGRRYSHVLDPSSGEPVVATPQSVTVHAPTCLVAGSAATIAMLQGDAQGEAWLVETGLRFLYIRANGTANNRFREIAAQEQQG